jgi:hypothetical protein
VTGSIADDVAVLAQLQVRIETASAAAEGACTGHTFLWPKLLQRRRSRQLQLRKVADELCLSVCDFRRTAQPHAFRWIT